MAVVITRCPPMPAYIIDKPRPHLIKGILPASAETEISMSDYQRMQTITHSLPNHYRTGIPAFMLNPVRLREVITLYMERRVFSQNQRVQFAQFGGTFEQRLQRVERQLHCKRAAKTALLDSMCSRFVEAKCTGNTVLAGSIERSIKNIDTQLRLESRYAAVVASCLYLSYMAAQDSVGVAQQLGVSPAWVRQVLCRVRKIGMTESEWQAYRDDSVKRRQALCSESKARREKERAALKLLRAESREARKNAALMARAQACAEQHERIADKEALKKLKAERCAAKTPRKTQPDDGLTTSQRWIRDGKCKRCGGKHGLKIADRKYCQFCLDMAVLYKNRWQKKKEESK